LGTVVVVAVQVLIVPVRFVVVVVLAEPAVAKRVVKLCFFDLLRALAVDTLLAFSKFMSAYFLVIAAGRTTV